MLQAGPSRLDPVEMDCKAHAGHGAPFGAVSVQMVAGDLQGQQLLPQRLQGQPKVKSGAQEHVAAYAAEDVQMEGFHDASAAGNWLI
jgi:hypothetical protein